MLLELQQPVRLSKSHLLAYHLITVAVILIGGFYAQWHTFTPHSDDFLSIVWYPGQNLLHRQPVPLDYPYPLWTPILMLPFSLWSATQGIQLWALFNLGVLALCILLVVYMLGWQHYVAIAPILSALTVIYYPAYIGILAGQIVFLMLLLLLLCLWAYTNEYYLLAGAILALTLIKPHLILLVTLMLLATALWNRNWKLLIGFAVVSASLVALAAPFAATPRQIFGGGVSDHLLIYISQGCTLWGISLRTVSRSLVPPAIASILLVFGTAYLWVAALRAHQLRERLFGLVAIASIVNFLIIPYSWSYNHVLLIFTICYAIQVAWRLNGAIRIAALALLLALALLMPPLIFSLLAQPHQLDVYFVLLPLSLLPILLALQWYAQNKLTRAGPTGTLVAVEHCGDSLKTVNR